MALLPHNLKTWIAKTITHLPARVNLGLLALNRNSNLVFGSEYARYRKFLHNHERSFDNVPLLLKTVNQAIREVAYYRTRYGGKEIGSLAEFEKTIGFVDKTEIVSNYESFLCGTINRDDYETGTTGGTSGKPLTFIAPKKRYVVEMATMHSLWARAGYDFTVRAVIRNHRMANGRQFVINPLTREIIFDGFRLTPEYFSIIYRTIRKLGIRFIHCYPSTAYEFATFMYRNRLDTSFIQAFLSGSENIFDYQLDLIQNRMGIRFYNWYGHSEKLVLAGYCESTDHYHVEPTYGYFELLDQHGCVVRKPGAFGEIVGTSFHNPGMPFIRYRTGDFAELVGHYCPKCERHLPVIKNIQGRWSGNRIYNADGSFVTTTALNLHNELYQVIDGMQYLQERRGKLTVLVMKSSCYTSEHESALYRHFTSKLHPDTAVSVRYVDRLLRKPNGKFVHIMSSVHDIPNVHTQHSDYSVSHKNDSLNDRDSHKQEDSF